MLKHSIGFKNKILALNDFKTIMTPCYMNIYDGPQPDSADLASSGTLLVLISLDGSTTGLSWNSIVDGAIYKNDSEVWKGVASNTGEAGWFRIYESADDPSLPTILNARIDGAVALFGSELNMSKTEIVAVNEIIIDEFSYVY